MGIKETGATAHQDPGRALSTVSEGLRQTREKASRFALLGMLSLGERKSGYDLKKAIATSTANFWSESYGNIYPTLKKLLAEGLIREVSERAAAGRRQKQLYNITETGRVALQHWLRQPVLERPEDNELLLKLFFGSMMSRGEACELIKTHREHHLALLKRFDAIEGGISAGTTTEMQKRYMRTTLSYGQAISRALVQWADVTEKLLRDWEA